MGGTSSNPLPPGATPCLAPCSCENIPSQNMCTKIFADTCERGSECRMCFVVPVPESGPAPPGVCISGSTIHNIPGLPTRITKGQCFNIPTDPSIPVSTELDWNGDLGLPTCPGTPTPTPGNNGNGNSNIIIIVLVVLAVLAAIMFVLHSRSTSKESSYLGDRQYQSSYPVDRLY